MSSTQPFRHDVQGLRGIAVLLVVAFHAWPAALPGGFVGVDVFFVISGYLITRLLLEEIDATGRIDFAAFYARRIRRLLPAAALVVVVTALLVGLRQTPLEAREFSSTALAAALYVSNIWFALRSVDYLQEGLQHDLLLHTWSLGVEEQFYLVWPLLLVAATMCLGRLGRRRAVAVTVGGVSALSILTCLWLTRESPSWAFFGLPTRAWELGAGAAAALAQGRLRGGGPAARQALALAGLVAVLTAALAFSPATRFPGHAALLPVLGSLAVIVAGDGGPYAGGVSRWLRLGLLQRLGDLSYSWYLWHWPILILVADLWPTADRNLVAAVGVAVSLGLARLTFVFVEAPVRRHAALVERPMRAFALAAVLVVATAGIAAGLRIAAGSRESEARRRIEQAVRDRPRLYEDRCFAAALDAEPPSCLYGAKDGRRTVALIGDSHAAQWFPALERLAAAKGLRLAVFVKAACPIAAVEIFDPKLNRPYAECTRWREAVLDRVAELRPALVMVANSSFYEPFARADREAMARWQRGLEQSLRRLQGIAGHVLLIRDTPRPGFRVPVCLARAGAQGPRGRTECSFRLREAIVPAALEVERAAVASVPGAAIVDLTAAICAGPVCPVERDGVILFHDAEHLSATFAGSLADGLWEQVPPAARAALGE